MIERLQRKFGSRRNRVELTYSEKIKLADIELNKLINFTKSRFKKIILIHHLTTEELQQLPSEDDEYFRHIAETSGIDFFSTRKYYTDKGYQSLFQDHIHLSAAGSIFFTEKLASIINSGD